MSAGVLERMVEDALAARLPAVEEALAARLIARLRDELRADAPVEGSAAIAALCREIGRPAGSATIHGALVSGELPSVRVPRRQASERIPGFAFRCRRGDVVEWATRRK